MTSRMLTLMTGFLILCSANASKAQGTTGLKIVSPTNGTLVFPGQSVTIAVSEDTPTGSAVETIAGETPILMTEPQPEGAFREFHLSIPASIDPGSYQIVALGIVRGTGKDFSSQPVTLVVPGTVNAQRIVISNGSFTFHYVGEQIELDVHEETDHGSRRLPEESLNFTSSNPSVASVDSAGRVTAQGTGKAQIIVSSGGISSAASITVQSSSTRGDLTGHGRVDRNDINVLTKGRNTFATGSNDARDLNQDGVIDDKDIEIEKSLCTYPNCATHK